MTNATLEARAAEVLLQKPIVVSIGGQEYKAAPPSLATLIAVSELIAELPHCSLEGKDIISETLFIARDCRIIGEIVAMLVLGAKPPQQAIITHFWQRLWKKSPKNEHEKLATKVLHELSPTELHVIMAKLLESLNLGDFFALTTFLLDINLTKKKVGETETTAPGH